MPRRGQPSADLDSVVSEISQQVWLLDGLVRYRFGGNAELMGAWASARNVEGPFRSHGEPAAGCPHPLSPSPHTRRGGTTDVRRGGWRVTYRALGWSVIRALKRRLGDCACPERRIGTAGFEFNGPHAGRCFIGT
jgi:hypothetical protein